ncbi:MAG: hypothetical protein R3F37_06695 [Candidatus Competibacteraceae bacterium]
MDRQAEKEKAEKKEIVETATKNSVDSIIRGLTDLKLAITRSLDELERQLISESQKLHNLRQAIDIEQKNLEEIHEIQGQRRQSGGLVVGSRPSKVGKNGPRFEADMTEKKSSWKKNKKKYERLKKERNEENKRTRQREEEDYSYSLKLARKKDQDAYAEKKASLEKELTEKVATLEKEWSAREAALAAREQELADLRTRVDAFPQELDRAVTSKEQTVTERLEFKYRHEAQMAAKETEGERKLSQQIITSLEAKIKEQEEQIRQLAQKANEAGLQVQSIALKAIEGAGSWRTLGSAHERSSEPGNR